MHCDGPSPVGRARAPRTPDTAAFAAAVQDTGFDRRGHAVAGNVDGHRDGMGRSGIRQYLAAADRLHWRACLVVSACLPGTCGTVSVDLRRSGSYAARLLAIRSRAVRAWWPDRCHAAHHRAVRGRTGRGPLLDVLRPLRLNQHGGGRQHGSGAAASVRTDVRRLRPPGFGIPTCLPDHRGHRHAGVPAAGSPCTGGLPRLPSRAVDRCHFHDTGALHRTGVLLPRQSRHGAPEGTGSFRCVLCLAGAAVGLGTPGYVRCRVSGA